MAKATKRRSAKTTSKTKRKTKPKPKTRSKSASRTKRSPAPNRAVQATAERSMDPVFARHPELEQVCLAARDGGDAAAYAAALSVYADWLNEQGSPWGELLASDADATTLQARCIEPLLALLPKSDGDRELVKDGRLAPPFAFQWERGVVTDIAWAFFDADSRFDDVSAELYEVLLRLPCVQLATILRIGNGPFTDEAVTHLAYDFEELEQRGILPSIRDLRFDLETNYTHAGDLGPAELPSLAGLCPHLANVRRLHLNICDDYSPLAELALEQLHCVGMVWNAPRAIRELDLPSLRRLVIADYAHVYDEPDPPYPYDADEICALFQNLGSLRELSLSPCDPPAARVLELASNSPGVRKLTSLELGFRYSDVRAELRYLVDHAEAFAHLSRFVLDLFDEGDLRLELDHPSADAIRARARELLADDSLVSSCEEVIERYGLEDGNDDDDDA